jgi:TonB family protein
MIRDLFVPAALLAATPLAAAQPPAAPAPAQAAAAARPWRVDWARYECQLIRKAAPGRPFATVFMTMPGGVHMTLRLVTEQGAPLLEGVDTVVLLPGGRAFPVTTDRSAQVRLQGIRNHYGLPREFRELMADATELQLRTGDRIRARVPLDSVRTALAAHRQCLSEGARDWGLDEAALAALSRRPSSTNIVGLSPDDYPTSALRSNAQGRVVMRITVTPEGRAADCVPVASSGRADFDATACRAALARGRFLPGLDAAGRPVAVRDVFQVGFSLPGVR